MMKRFIPLLAASVLGSALTVLFLKNEIGPAVNTSGPVIEDPTIKKVSYREVTPFSGADFTTAAEVAVHGVVHVKTKAEGKQYYQINPLEYFFFGQAEPIPRKTPPQLGSGSGVVISQDGYIVTNNHVIDGADEIEVMLNDNRSYSAKVIGADPNTDIALLKVDEDNLPAVPVGDSDDLKLGEWVLAVGNPYNLNSTVTAGIISAKGRSIDIMNRQGKGFAPIESFIQTDAAVNPGNSGGALVNTKGELIGINTAIKSPTGTFTGYSFAVPVNIVKKVMEDLRDFGVVQRGFLGVTIRNVDSELANELNLNQPSGVYVNGLMDEGAAADAGVKEGDVIIAVGGESIRNVPELQEQVGRYRPGDEVTISVLREGEVKQIPLVLRNKFGTTKVIEKESADKWVVLGAECAYPEKELLEELNLENGVQVKKLNDGKLKSAGLKEGFIIVRVDKMPVESPEQLAKLFSGQTGGMLIEGVYPNGKRGYYGVGM